MKKFDVEDMLADLKLLKDQLAEIPTNAVPNIDDILRHHLPTLCTNLELALKRIAELEGKSKLKSSDEFFVNSQPSTAIAEAKKRIEESEPTCGCEDA